MAKKNGKKRKPPADSQERAVIELHDQIERLDLEFSELRGYVKRVMATTAARSRRDKPNASEPADEVTLPGRVKTPSPCRDRDELNDRITAGLGL